MNKKNALNTLIVSSIFLILYTFVGHDFVKYYFGGKAEMLNAAEHINELCNANGECPTSLEGWRQLGKGGDRLTKGSMLYLITPARGGDGDKKSKGHQTFRLVYRFFMPDDWFEVQGGVGEKITSGWKSR